MRKLLILDLVLLAIVVAGSIRLRDEWITFDATHQTDSVQAPSEALPKLAITSPMPGTRENWTEIPSRNPFSFDRNDITVLEPEGPAAPPGPKPHLFGTITLGGERLAMVGPGRPGDRSYRPMKAGEVIDGWTIVEVLDKSITIEANSLTQSVIINDPTAQVPRDSTRTLAPSAPSVTIPASQPSPALLPSTPQPQPSISQPARGQSTTRRRIIQQTPFGTREIEIEEPSK